MPTTQHALTVKHSVNGNGHQSHTLNGHAQAKTRPSWIESGNGVRAENVPGVYSSSYDLEVLAENGAIDAKEFKRFQQRTRLKTMYWRAYWTRGAIIEAGGRADFPNRAGAVIVFMHGWDGSGAIWENLPAQVCEAERDALVLVPDVNGFGRSPFLEPEQLEFNECNPKANMRAVEEWLALLRVLGGRRKAPVTFVGHSMSGAALFYLNEKLWEKHQVGRVAIAPALLPNDTLRKGFYRTLGLGIWATYQLQLNRLSETLSPMIVNRLIAGASKAVQSEHMRVFKQTSKSTLGHTFFAMGHAKQPPPRKQWERFSVVLGHDDRLVGLGAMLDTLVELGFNSRQVKVVFGDHYFLSVGRRSRPLHEVSRAIALEEIHNVVAQTRKA